jgi:hypothetical protein
MVDGLSLSFIVSPGWGMSKKVLEIRRLSQLPLGHREIFRFFLRSRPVSEEKPCRVFWAQCDPAGG